MTSPLRVVIGTAGHVDHGKTALVKALTGIDTDRLPEEKRRGITLEAGYANLALPGVGTAGVVDVPGHERFLRAMVGAAGGIDVAILCVAADEGPMPQTAEHLDVLRLLGVQAGVIAMTKADLLPDLGADHRELLTLELRELVQGTFLEGAPIVEVSARTGKGLPELIGAVAAAVKARQAAPRPEQAPLFLPLDRTFAVKGFGTVVTGTLFSGALATGDEVDLAGAGARARGVRVRGVQVHGAPIDKARAGQRTAANLAGIEVQDAPRGAALVQAGTLESVGAAQVLDVEIELLPWAARPLRDRARLLAHIGTAQVPCVVALVDRAQLAPGERALGQLRLSQPAAAIAGLRFLLRGELPKPSRGHHPMVSPGEGRTHAMVSPSGGARAHASTLGGGRILAVASRKRRRREPDAAALQALAGDDPLAQADQLLLESGYPGASAQRLAARGAFTVKSAEKALERLAQAGKAVLFDREARLYAHKDVLGALDAKVLARLREHSQRDSIEPSIAREELRQRAGAPPQKLFAKALASLAERGELRADAERVHPPGATAKLSGPDADAQEKLAGVLEGAGLSPPRADELPALIGQTPQRTQALLKALAGSGRASKVSEELWFGAAPLMDLRRRVLSHLSQHGSIDAQSFKELTGLTRKFAIPLLEYFDREKLTLRIGDKRVLRKAER
jgi:selenocysteine-specific elongation factor